MTDERDPDAPRQKVVRIAGSRRARLTAVPGTDTDPERVVKDPQRPKGPKGPNDEQLMQDVPPHY